jgi:hypothetical protein
LRRYLHCNDDIYSWIDIHEICQSTNKSCNYFSMPKYYPIKKFSVSE